MVSETREMPVPADLAARGGTSVPIRSGVCSAAGRSHTGLVRGDNQDRMFVGQSVFAVADGMGGHRAGATAAEAALEPIVQLDHGIRADEDVERVLRAAVMASNANVLAEAHDVPERKGMGTTLIALAVGDGRAHLAWVGDSRAYRLRAGILEQLTVDHTLVRHLVDAGALPPEDVSDHPQRAVVTRAVGLDWQVDVDIAVADIELGDTFLLCSDGLTGVVDDDTIAEILLVYPDPDATADALVERALANGGPDNVTVIVVHTAHP